MNTKEKDIIERIMALSKEPVQVLSVKERKKVTSLNYFTCTVFNKIFEEEQIFTGLSLEELELNVRMHVAKEAYEFNKTLEYAINNGIVKKCNET